MGPTSRVIVLIDMDCFYCQVEEKLNPELEGKPIAVVQYNAWRGGGIIAVNYPARDEGVTRHMRGNDAKKKCPSIRLVQVPEVRGKADLTKYRDAGKRVADVLATFTPLLQRASVDEAYLDITELVEKRIETSLDDLSATNLSNTYVVGCDLKDFVVNSVTNKEFSVDNLKLAVGGLITEEIRHEVFLKTGYKCSAGIAHNKILAKLVCSLHKPNKQTILPQDEVPKFFETMPVSRIKSLGGKFGQTLTNDFQITYMGQLAKIPEKDLAKKYDEKTGNWLYNIARGIDMELVTTKLISKSIACCKNFTGRAALTTSESVEHWLNELAAEMSERLNKDLHENNRKAKHMVVSFSQEINKKDVSSSRTHPLVSYDSKKIAQAAFNVIKKFCLHSDGSYHLKFLGLSASNFEDVKKIREITSFFQAKNNKNSLEQSNFTEVSYHIKDENCDPMNNEITEENVYCQVTQELKENPDDFIFYDDSFRIKSAENSLLEQENNLSFHFPCDATCITPGCSTSVVEDPLQTKNTDNLLQQSNISDITNDKEDSYRSNINVTRNVNEPSFFSKYFNQGSSRETANNFPLQHHEEIDRKREMHITQEATEICSECQKLIPISELVSHQDHHFAQRLSKAETTLHKDRNIKPTTVSPKKKKNVKGVKRKAENSSTLTIFFKKDEESVSELSETCLECNKRIRIEEISSHMDYHMAKKLHQEINSIKSSMDSKTNSIKTKKSAKTKNKTTKSVISFFRPV